MILKPISTEKGVKMVELDNTLIFETEMRAEKPEIRAEIEKLFNVKVVGIRTLIRQNKKIVYVKLNKANPAIDVATKLGMI